MHSKATLRPREKKETQFIQLQVKSKMVKSRAVNPHWYTLDKKKKVLALLPLQQLRVKKAKMFNSTRNTGSNIAVLCYNPKSEKIGTVC